MPSVVVDSVVVTGGWDPSALERGLAESSAKLQQFVQQTANTTVGLKLELLGGGDQQFRTTLADLEALLGTFRQRAAAELQLPTPTLDAHPATAALESIVAAATAADARITALRTSLPAPDTTALRAALAAVLGSIAAVEQGLAQLNGQRLQVDAGGLSERLAQLRSQLTNVAPIQVPVVLEAAGVTAALQRLVAGLPPVALPVTLAAGDLPAAITGIERQLAGLAGVTVPVRLDLAQVDEAMAALRARIAATPPITVPVSVGPVDPAAFTGFGQAVTQSFGRIEASLAGLTATISAALAPISGLFTGIIAGAQDAVAEFQAAGANGARAFEPLTSGAARAAAVAKLLSELPPPVIDTAPAVSAIDTLIQRQQLAIRSQADFLTVLSQPITPPVPPPSGLREIIGQQEQIRASAEQAALAEATLGQAFADAGAQSVGLSSGIRQAITFNQQLAEAARQAADGLSVQARAALAAAQANAGAQAAGAGPGAGAALGAVAGANALAAAQSGVTSGAERMRVGLADAARQVALLGAAEREAVTGTGRMAAGFAEAAIQARLLAEGSVVAVGGLGRVGGAARSVLTEGEGGSRALHSIATNLALVGASSLTAEGPLLRIAEGLVLFSGGVGGILAAGVALAGVGLVFQQLTEDSRKAAEEFKKASDALKALRDQQRDPIAVSIKFTGEVSAELDDVRARIERLKAARADLASQSVSLAGADPEAFALIQGQIESLDRAIAKLGKTFVDLGGQVQAGKFDVVSRQFQQLTQAAEQASQDQLAIVQVGFQAQQQALEAALAQDLTTRQQFAAASIALAQQQSSAVIKTLQDQLFDVQIRPTANQGQRDAQKAEEAHLTRLITLERAKIALEEARIRNQQRLADITILERAGLGTAGGVSAVQPTEAPAITIPLKPQLDLTELQAAVDAFAKESDKINLDAGIQRAIDTAKVLNPILAEIGLKVKDIGNASVQGPRAVEQDLRHLIQASRDVTSALKGITDAVSNLHLLDDAAAHAVNSVFDLVGAFGQLKIANQAIKDSTSDAEAAAAQLEKVAAVFGVIGGAIGAIGGIVSVVFGPSAAQQENLRLMAENNARLATLAAALDRSIQGVGGQVKVGQAAAALAPFTNQFRGEIASGFSDKAFAEITEIAGRFGVSLAQLEAIAKQNGITLFKDGQVVSGAFEALANATGLTIDAMTHFASSFTDQLDFAGLQAKIGGGLGDAVDQFKRDLTGAGAKGVDSSFIAHFFDGIDLRSDAAGFQKRLQELLAKFAPDSKFFTEHPSLLGGLTPEDWRKILNDGADAMALLNDQTKALTQSFAEQFASTQLRSRLAGEDQSPAASFQREIDTLLRTLAGASPAIADQLAHLNLGDPAGVRKALLSLFDQSAAGGLQLTADQQAALNQLLNDGAGFLDGFNKSLADATKRVNDFNIPQGFRRAALAFQTGNLGPDTLQPPTAVHVPVNPVSLIQPLPDHVQAVLDTIAQTTPPDLLVAVDGVTKAVSTAPPDLLNLLDVLSGATADSGKHLLDAINGIGAALQATQAPPTEPGGPARATAPFALGQPQQVSITFGDIIVQVSGEGKDPRQIAEETVREFRRLARAQSGDTLQFGLR